MMRLSKWLLAIVPIHRPLAVSPPPLCSSIIAIAHTTDPTAPSKEPAEEFVCEHNATGLLPIVGTPSQIDTLRHALYDGRWISAETTLSGLTTVDFIDSGGHGEQVVYLPDRLEFVPVTENNNLRRERVGEKAAGVKKVLVVKVTDVNGLAHPDPPPTISNKIFGTYGDTTNMATQFELCSYGSFTITNEYGFDLEGEAKDAKGVVEVTIDVGLEGSSRNQIQRAAKEATERKINLSLPGPFHHILYILQDCYGDDCSWAAYGGVNSWFTVYKGDNYKFPAVAMHEIGHNLNLAHSGGLNGKTYTDHSCLMGNPWFRDDVSAMCYNPAKNFQLSQQGSWYSNHIQVWNSGNSQPNAKTETLIGIADYGNNQNNFPVVMKLETTTPNDIFVGFNRVTGINSASKDAIDKVTVIQQGNDGVGYSTSKMLAELSSGQSYTISNWQGSGKNMVITVKDIRKRSDPWTAEVEFSFDGGSASRTPVPTSRPTDEPSLQPLPLPTLFPTPKPTTPSPTQRPNTASPTKRCGDDICTNDEDHTSCPNDCINAEFSTYNDVVGAKGSNGTMFILQAVRDVEINSIYTFVRGSSIDLVQVYTRQGTYNGYEATDEGWVLVFDEEILSHGKNQETELRFSSKVTIPEGQFQSFYIYSPNNLAYRSENVEEGDLIKNDSSFRFYAGIAIAYGRFGDGQIFRPRVFSGILSYNTVNLDPPTTAPTDSATSYPTYFPTTNPIGECGDGACDMNEHVDNCALDCMNIGYNGAASGSRASEGIMFYIKARRDIVVNSFDVYGISNAASPFQVYTRVGSYGGYEASEKGWTLFYDNPSLQQLGRFTLISLGDFSSGVLIPAGAIMSFYLFTPTMVLYDVGSGSPMYSENNDLELYEGSGITGGLFAGDNAEENVIAGRVFAGTIRYDVIKSAPATPSPTINPVPTPAIGISSNQPIELCGNFICESDEDSASCPSDCADRAFLANEIGAKGADGVMFSLRAVGRNITLKSYSFFTGAEATLNVQVYTKAGLFQEYENSVDVWELIYNSSTDQLGRNVPTVLSDWSEEVTIRANTLQSFLIYTPNKVMYKGGTSEGSQFSSDGTVELFEGIGLSGTLFAWTIYSPRVFRGSVTYDIIGSIANSPKV